jgi:molecular chaperone GrpE
MVHTDNIKADEMIFEDEAVPTSDDLELEESEGLGADKVKAIREKLRECEKMKQENLDGWQRARADFLNFKRRTEEDAKRQSEQGVAKYVETILPLFDSFALAMKGSAWDEADTNFKYGFEMIRSQLGSILKELRVETVDPMGAPFDPRYHEAISEAEVEDEALVQVVIETVQPGYKIGDTTIRPARVVVGKKQS